MRLTLDQTAIAPQALNHIKSFHQDVVAEVAAAVARDRIVVVGMAQNVFVKRARKALKQAGYDYTYLEYGSYLSQWKKRLAIKLWSGWPTFPQIYVRGKLIGGTSDLKAALTDGSFAKHVIDG